MALVKILSDDDGTIVENPKWCFAMTSNFADGERTLCSGQVFGYGEGAATYKRKDKGKVTCPKCIRLIKFIRTADI